MKIHEYQAKSIFRKCGIPVLKGVLAESREDVAKAVRELGGQDLVVKAQVHTGGRGKAGGIRRVKGEADCVSAASEMLGSRLITHQSGPQGKVVRKLLIEESVSIAKEYYLAVTLDRRRTQGVIISSQAGGMDIEEVARAHPEKISKKYFDVVFGLSPFQARQVAYGLAKNPEAVKNLVQIVQKMADLFVQLDATLLEINPLAETREGRWVALDAKIDFDDNSLYRHPEIGEMRDSLEEDTKEVEAKKSSLSYVGMEGNVGCMVNGAGLAMATMDVIKLAGGMPANFLDVGGGAKVDQVKAAFKIILQDPNVKAILVNIFGGIMKCDVVAEGILQAVREVQVRVPLVVRLEGTRVEEGQALLKNSGIRIVSADGLAEAASRAVDLAGKS